MGALINSVDSDEDPTKCSSTVLCMCLPNYVKAEGIYIMKILTGNPNTYVFVVHLWAYSKTRLKRPLKNRQSKGFKDKW